MTLLIRIIVFILVTIILYPSSSLRAVPAPTRMDFVLVVTDDQRWDTLQYMPRIGRELVTRGIVFRNAFVTTPLCCPSRASLLTGQYAHHTRVLANQPPLGGAPKFKDSSTLATWLKAAGYRTGLFGKYLNAYNKIARHVPPGWDEWGAFVRNEYFNYTLNENGKIRAYGRSPRDYSTAVLAKKAVAFIEQVPSPAPLFVYFAPFAPHTPATPAPPDLNAFEDLAPWRPPAYNEADIRDKPAWIRRLPLLDGARQARTDEFRRRQLGSLQAVDRAVGTLIEAMRRSGRLERMVFIFTSDNGLSWGEHRWANQKSCPYEECIRVPIVVVAPGVAPRVESRLVLNIDIAPALTELAGVRPGAPVDGISLVPLLRNSSRFWRTSFLIEFWARRGELIPDGEDADEPPEFVAIRTDRWVYIEYTTGEKELYDLIADPHELQNLAGDPARSAIIAQMKSQMEALRAQPPTRP